MRTKPLYPENRYVPGAGCRCAAHSESDCGCEGVDWTPAEVYRLDRALRIVAINLGLANMKEPLAGYARMAMIVADEAIEERPKPPLTNELARIELARIAKHAHP